MTVPYRFEVTATTAELRAEHDGLDAGAETGIEVTVAGRVMLHRAQGKLAFATLRDGSGGEVQLFALAAVTGDFEGFTRISLGDWVGASGEVVKTKRGELSVKVSSWTMLAETRRSFGGPPAFMAACSLAAASRPMKSFFSSLMKRSMPPSNGP